MSNLRVVDLGGIRYIGEIVRKEKNFISIKNPVEINWIQTETNLTVISVDNPLKDSSSNIMEIQIQNILSSYDPSYELVCYYQMVLPKIQEQQEEVKEYLTKLNKVVSLKMIDEYLVKEIAKGKLSQPGSSNIM